MNSEAPWWAQPAPLCRFPNLLLSLQQPGPPPIGTEPSFETVPAGPPRAPRRCTDAAAGASTAATVKPTREAAPQHEQLHEQQQQQQQEASVPGIGAQSSAAPAPPVAAAAGEAREEPAGATVVHVLSDDDFEEPSAFPASVAPNPTSSAQATACGPASSALADNGGLNENVQLFGRIRPGAHLLRVFCPATSAERRTPCIIISSVLYRCRAFFFRGQHASSGRVLVVPCQCG